MLVDQAVHRGKRVAMQTVKELTRGFSFSQATAASCASVPGVWGGPWLSVRS